MKEKRQRATVKRRNSLQFGVLQAVYECAGIFVCMGGWICKQGVNLPNERV